MIGAISGDIIGSAFEGHGIKSTRFPLFTRHSRFTDDTVLTVASAESILRNIDCSTALKAYGRDNPSNPEKSGRVSFDMRTALSYIN
jgi:ADP-ribosylglycohydrolase